MLMTILAVHGIKVHPLVEPHFHTSFNDCSHTVDVCRIVDSNVLNVPTLGKVETFEFGVLFFERCDVFTDVTRLYPIFRRGLDYLIIQLNHYWILCATETGVSPDSSWDLSRLVVTLP